MKEIKMNSLTKIGVFYDGNYLLHVSNYYTYIHERKSRISISGLNDFIRHQVAQAEGTDYKLAQIVDAHYFKGRVTARDAIQRENQLYYERLFDDILMLEGITTHYLPLKSSKGERQDKGIDVWFALEAFELAFHKRFDVLVIVASDGDYVPLVRKLNTLGTRVMVIAWDFEYTDDLGNVKMTRTSQDLLREVSYPVAMHELIDNDLMKEELRIANLFVPPRADRITVKNGNGASTEQYSAATATDGKVLSTIKALKAGFGFIHYSTKDVFFHYTALLNCDFNELKVGDKVQFILEINDLGNQVAKEITLIEESAN